VFIIRLLAGILPTLFARCRTLRLQG